MITTGLKERGFSFMELVVVLSVIVAMASGAFVVGNSILQNGRFNAAKSEVAALSLAVSQYHFELGVWPDSLETLTTAVGQYGPWADAESLSDPWGHAFNYAINANGRQFAVWSNGANGANDSGNVPAQFNSDDIGIIGN